MTARDSCHADQLVPGQYVAKGSLIHKLDVVKTVAGRTTLVDDAGEPWRVQSNTDVQLATDAEIARFEQDRDLHAFVHSLKLFADQVLGERLPVPPRGQRFVLGFDLASDDELEPWARWLRTSPHLVARRPVIEAAFERVEVRVSGPMRCDGCGTREHDGLCDPAVIQADAEAARIGTMAEEFGPMYADKLAGEFGPDLDDLVDAALTGSKPALQELATGPYGFAPPGGHKTAATEDAYRADRYSGES